MKLFQIDYKALVTLLLPTFLRRPVMTAFLRAQVSGVQRVYNRFVKNRNDNLYRLKINGQVCYLRRALNDAFPEAGGQIRIDDGALSGLWRYAWDEDYDPYRNYLLIPDEGTLFWDKDTILEGVSGFVVYAPGSIYDINNDARMRALLNEYKLLSKNYTIVYE